MHTQETRLTGTHYHDSEMVYRCPGEAHPVSRAVHLGRLASGYAACEQCAWRFESEKSDLVPLADDHRPKIRRTTYGMRGPYINAIDRAVASQLATVLASHLLRVSSDKSPVIAVGYDGHRGAPDIFAGVLSSVLQSGCSVVDAGRCTAASLHHCLRSEENANYGLLVTGSGGQSSEIGIDVICYDGRPIAVPWADYGLSVTSSGVVDGGLSSELRNHESAPVLQLPTNISRFAPRAHRQSGQLLAVALEDRYGRWLSRWWPSDFTGPLLLTVSDEFTVNRLKRLQEQTDGYLIVQQSGVRKVSDDRRGNLFRIEIHDDDRHLSVWSTRGRQIPAEDLAGWINSCHRTSGLHLTAHVSTDIGQVHLCDTASPQSGEAQHVICDGLAVAGLIATLAQHNPLPG